MDAPKKRWGWSALSKKNRAHAYSEEVMVDKETGEFLIKTQDGDFMSYNVISRTKSHIDAATMAAQSKNIYGKMYMLELTDIFPQVLTSANLNLTSSETIDIPGEFSKILISLDMDSLVVTDGNLTRERFDPKITLEYSVINKGTGTHGDTVSSVGNLLTTFNQKVFNVPIADISTMTGIHISKLEIIMNEADPLKNYRHILNSIIVITE